MRKLHLFLVILILLLGCNDDPDISKPSNYEVNSFIWSAMNRYYYWADEIPDLSDEKRSQLNIFQSFLNKSQPETFFEGLLYEPETVDRFSWIVDDYDELEDSFQGISESFGFEYGLVIMPDNFNIYGYVRYVIPDSPAAEAGLKRGDIFTQVDNAQLNRDNYLSLLTENIAFTLTLATLENGVVTATDQRLSMTAVELKENPILISKVIEVGDKSVAYLLYNQFINNNEYHEELNQVFGEFKSKGVDELVLDLRYNRGGSLLTSRILSSQIYGDASSDDILGSVVSNSNLSYLNSDILFLDELPILDEEGQQVSSNPMERLNLSRLYVLTGRSTASASEFVIVALRPYMDIVTIGTTTVGKNVGSTTLYDSRNFGKESKRNTNHKYALQPIIFQLANSLGFKDYTSGLEPDIFLNEYNFLESGLVPLGDPGEPLLATALADIAGESARIAVGKEVGIEFLNGPKRGQDALNGVIVDDMGISD